MLRKRRGQTAPLDREHLKAAVQEAMEHAKTAASGVSRDVGMPDRMFVYLHIKHLRLEDMVDICAAVGWKVKRHRMRQAGRPHNPLHPFALFYPFGERDRQTAAMQAAVRVLQDAGYEACVGHRWDWTCL